MPTLRAPNAHSLRCLPRRDSALMKLFFSRNVSVSDPAWPDDESTLSQRALCPDPNLDMSKMAPKKVFEAFNATRAKLSPLIDNWNKSGSNDSLFGSFCSERNLVYIFYILKELAPRSSDGSYQIAVPGWLRRDVPNSFKVGGGSGALGAGTSSGAPRTVHRPHDSVRKQGSGKRKGVDTLCVGEESGLRGDELLASAIHDALAPQQQNAELNDLLKEGQLSSNLTVRAQLDCTCSSFRLY